MKKGLRASARLISTSSSTGERKNVWEIQQVKSQKSQVKSQKSKVKSHKP